MKLVRRTFMAAMSLAVLAAPLAASAQTRSIQFGYGLNEASNQGRAARYFAEQVEKLSNGKIRVRTTGAAALGTDVQMQQALVNGTQEMMVGSTATLVGIAKEMALWDAPFLFNNSTEADAVLDGPVGTKVLNTLNDKGLVGLVYWENGFRNLTNNKRPVTKVEDLAGIKLRVMQNPVYLESFSTLGASPVPIAFSELFGALQGNVVDGQENPFNTILSSKFYDVQKYLSVTQHVYSPWVVLASRKFWDGLSKDEQKVILDAARASRDFERKDTREEAARALASLKRQGMQVNEVPVAEIGRMREKLAGVHDTIAGNVGKDLWNEAQAELKKIRAAKK